VVVVAQDARPTGAGANVAMVVVAQNARPTGAGANVAMVVVAQDARPTPIQWICYRYVTCALGASW